MMRSILHSLLCASVFVVAMPLGAQVAFAWPSNPPNVRAYSSIETCLALYKNSYNRSHRQSMLDTQTSASTGIILAALKDPVRQCMQKFPSSRLLEGRRAHVNAVQNTYYTLLAAGRDADARGLVKAWFASLAPGEDSLRHQGAMGFLRWTLNVRPVRWDDAWQLVESLDRPEDWRARFGLANTLMEQAYYRYRDSAQALRAAHWLVRASRDPARPGDFGARSIYRAQRLVQMDVLFDSLQKSTSAYLRYLNTLGAKLTEDEIMAQAPPLHGDYWFSIAEAGQASADRPKRGAVSVVIPLQSPECASAKCVELIDFVKRVHARLPVVEFTFVTKTKGYHGLVIEPPTPDREAHLIDSVYHTVYRVPATLVVHRTAFRRVDDVDRRRVNVASPNDETYPDCSIKAFLTIGFACAYVLDRQGRLIEALELDKFSMPRVERMLDALVNQSEQ